ncbi:MAG: hypothetical protein J7527_16095, partial [Chitinophagaceae bacterium]|nr:hypothetical protein [Chitinophagaceae bacterium]
EFSFEAYNNSCGQLDISRYPLFEVVMTRYKKRSVPLTPSAPTDDLFYFKYERSADQHYGFIRTENGFRLYEMSVR